jgi:HSP20 family molecular chaperone IbpA
MQDFWDEMGLMERRVDDLVRQFFGTRTRLAYPTLPLFVRKPFVPTMDIVERSGDLVVKLELPGIDPEKDVQIEVRDHTLVIKGERRCTDEVKEETYYRMEASYGEFERQIPIPQVTADTDIRATYVDGVLQVVVPEAVERTEASPGRRIPIAVGKKEMKAA